MPMQMTFRWYGEGNDKIKLSGIVEGLIIPTNGFSVFKDKPLLELIKKIAAEIKALYEKVDELGIIVGAGNIWRGRDAVEKVRNKARQYVLT